MSNNLLVQLAENYSIDLEVLIIIYFSSILPIYIGLFLMFYGLIRKKGVSKTFSILKNRDYIKNPRGNLFIIGLCIHIFGWISPYIYILIFSKNFHILFKIAISAIIFYIIKKLIDKYAKNTKNK